MHRDRSPTPSNPRIFRRGGAITSALWVLLLWVSPVAVSMWVRSSAAAGTCCHRSHAACCERHHDSGGPQVSSDPCGSACRDCGDFLLGTDFVTCLPGRLEFAVAIASEAPLAAYSSSAARVPWDAARFERPPPFLPLLNQV